ncbi:hypothetical protein SLA2020_348900 [Shorea laevis]
MRVDQFGESRSTVRVRADQQLQKAESNAGGRTAEDGTQQRRRGAPGRRQWRGRQSRLEGFLFNFRFH